jgi:transposase-like protein
MGTTNPRYSVEVKERAVRMVLENGTNWACRTFNVFCGG